MILGKTTFFVYNQAKIDCLPQEKITALNTELAQVEDENKELATQVRTLSTGNQKAYNNV
jgi:26S proteasome regulatory subunit (ATPase 3-interacting protein)